MFKKLFTRNKSDTGMEDDNTQEPNDNNNEKVEKNETSHSDDQHSDNSIERKKNKLAQKETEKMLEVSVTNENENENDVVQNIADEDEDEEKNSRANGSEEPTDKQSGQMGDLTVPGYQMMGSSATNERIQQLMEWRGGPKDTNDRSKSINIADVSTDSGKHPKKRRQEPLEEERRHSMFPKDKELVKEQNMYATTKKKRKDDKKDVGELKKVPYRVKNEIFVLYDFYQPVRILGSGAYAVVCEAIDTRNGRKVAIKKNKGVFDHITDARRILREIKLLMHFKHQDIIDLIDVVPPDAGEVETFNEVYLVMPKMETTLAKVIRSKQKLTDRHFQFFIYQILRGLKYMHSSGVIHRDLKPENILINGADCDVKITDFGLARGVSKDDGIGKPTEYVVTRWYRSPEVMCSAGMYDEAVDLWSVGCMMAEMVLRRPLFPGQNYLDQLKIIFETMGTPKDLTWIKTPEAKRWVQKLKPHDGKDLQKIFEKASPKARDLLLKMLVLNPRERITAVQGLEHEWLSDLHREEDEITCPKFDLSFEFEKAIKTKFGVRHMMYDALISYQNQQLQKPQHRYKKKKKSKKDTSEERIVEENDDDNNDDNNENENENEKKKPRRRQKSQETADDQEQEE